jgi:hypothetical protein
MLDCSMATPFVGELCLTWPQVQYRFGTECNGLSYFPLCQKEMGEPNLLIAAKCSMASSIRREDYTVDSTEIHLVS